MMQRLETHIDEELLQKERNKKVRKDNKAMHAERAYKL